MATGYTEKAYQDLEKNTQKLTKREKESEYEIEHHQDNATCYGNGAQPRYDSLTFDTKTNSAYYIEPLYETTPGSNNDDPYVKPVSIIQNEDVPYYNTPAIEERISPYNDSRNGLTNISDNMITSGKADARLSGYEEERLGDYYNQPNYGKLSLSICYIKLIIKPLSTNTVISGRPNHIVLKKVSTNQVQGLFNCV